MGKGNTNSVVSRKSRILELLKARPLSPTQILEKEEKKPTKEEWAKKAPMYKKTNKPIIDRELRSLNKTYLNPLLRDRKVTRLPKKGKLIYRNPYSLRTESISNVTFMETAWLEDTKWESGGDKNPYRAYYFVTPITSKWKEIFEEVIIKKIIKRFEEYIQNKEEIEKSLEELWDLCQKIEMIPKIKKLPIKQMLDDEEDLIDSMEDMVACKGLLSSNLNIKNEIKNLNDKELKEFMKKNRIIPKKKIFTKKDLEESKGNIFGFDFLKEEFYRHLFKRGDRLDNLRDSFIYDLDYYLSVLHRSLLLQEIKISNVLKNELEKSTKHLTSS